MKITSTSIKDLFIIEPKLFIDDRGYFMESYQKIWFSKNFPKINFIQDNESYSSYGVLRGLHFQTPPYSQTKLVRVILGEVLDVAVDLRKESKTFGKYFSLKLSSSNKKQLLIPRGFAHGFVTLSKEAILSYKVDNIYNKQHDMGIRFDDKTIDIDWKINSSNIRISPKDNNLPFLDNINLI